MTFEDPRLVLVGNAQNIVLGAVNNTNTDGDTDPDSPNALDLGLDD
jgi:hypothetical protein